MHIDPLLLRILKWVFSLKWMAAASEDAGIHHTYHMLTPVSRSGHCLSVLKLLDLLLHTIFLLCL